jgi:hypothetical protein
MMRDSDVQRTIESLEKNMEKKLYLVEVMSTFRMRYVVEARSEEHALDEVTMEESNSEFEEFSQEHIGTHIFGSRELTEEQYFELFDKDNGYLKEWTVEQKKRFINTIDYKDEEDTDNGV